jgi:hypothetical protein
MVLRGLWSRVSRAGRWLRNGPTWDGEDVEGLYGKQANRGYGSGIGDMVNRHDDWDRTRRAERRARRRSRG